MLVKTLPSSPGSARRTRNSATQSDTGRRQGVPDEERHLDWLETQLSLIHGVGEANYLAQQLHE